MRTKRAEQMEEVMIVLVAAGKPVGRAHIAALVSASGSTLAYVLKLMEDRGLVESIRQGTGKRQGTRYLYKATARGHAVDFRMEKEEQEANGAIIPLFMKMTLDREHDALALERFTPV